MAAERTAMEAVVVDIGDPKRGEGGAALNASGKEIGGQELQAFGESSPAACGAESSKTAAAIHSVDEDLESRRSGESNRSSPELRLSERSLKATKRKASFQVRAAQAAEKEWQLLVMVLRGRARQWLKRNEMASAAISVCYLVLIFVQIVMEEMPLGDEFNSSFVQIFSWVDLAFLVFFFGEYAGHILVDGFKYFRRTDGTWEKLYIVDATTVVMSLVLSSLNAAKVIDTQLSIFRMFRLLRPTAGQIVLGAQHRCHTSPPRAATQIGTTHPQDSPLSSCRPAQSSHCYPACEGPHREVSQQGHVCTSRTTRVQLDRRRHAVL